MLFVAMQMVLAQKWTTNQFEVLVKLKKSQTECLKLLIAVYGEGVMSRTQIFEWHKRFKNGSQKVENDPTFASGRPFTSKTDDNITRVKQLVQNDRRLTM